MTKRKVLIVAGAVVIALLVVAFATQLTTASYTSVRDALRAHGATVQENGLGSQPFLNGTDHRLTVNGAGIDVFEYRSTLGASLDARRISSDGSTFSSSFGPLGGQAATVDYLASPHWFHTGRVIVLYVGQDASILGLLQTVLGKQFAGGTIPASGSSSGDYPAVLAQLRALGVAVVDVRARTSTTATPNDAVRVRRPTCSHAGCPQVSTRCAV
jgi:hypothetical protein